MLANTTILEIANKVRSQLDEWFKKYSKDLRPIIKMSISTAIGTARVFDLCLTVDEIEVFESDEYSIADLTLEHCLNVYQMKIHNMAIPFVDEKGNWLTKDTDWQNGDNV